MNRTDVVWVHISRAFYKPSPWYPFVIAFKPRNGSICSCFGLHIILARCFETTIFPIEVLASRTMDNDQRKDLDYQSAVIAATAFFLSALLDARHNALFTEKDILYFFAGICFNLQSKQDNLLSWYKKYINPNEQESILNPPLLYTIPQHGPSYFTIPESYEIKRNQDDNWKRKWRQSIQWIFEDSVYSATFPTNIRDAFPFNTTAQQTHFTNPDSSLFCFFFGSCYVVLIAKQSPLISVPADASAYNALNETLTWYICMSECQRKGSSTLNRLISTTYISGTNRRVIS